MGKLRLALLVASAALVAVRVTLAVAEAGRHPLVVKNPAPVLEVRSVTATQVSLDLLIWSERPEKAGGITGDLSLALDRALREKGFAV